LCFLFPFIPIPLVFIFLLYSLLIYQKKKKKLVLISLFVYFLLHQKKLRCITWFFFPSNWTKSDSVLRHKCVAFLDIKKNTK
jgi:hypothetical protein